MASDRFHLGDGLAVKLECGHPNKKAGELCDLCGAVVPEVHQPEPVGESSERDKGFVQ
jgi:hypothetical protein